MLSVVRRHVRSVALLLVALTLLGCLPDTTPPNREIAQEIPASPRADGPIVVTFAAYETERPLYRPIIEKFNAEHPDIHVQFVSLDDFYHFGDQPAAGGELHLAVSSADTAAAYVQLSDIQQRYVRDLRPYIDADASFDPADYYPRTIAPMSDDGGVYALPNMTRVPILAYNKTLWAEAWLPPSGPQTTWPELIAAAEQLTRTRGDQVDVYGFLDRFGATVSRDDAGTLQPDFTNAKALEALQFYVTLLRDYSPHKQLPGYISSQGISDVISAGESGMWLTFFSAGGPLGDANDAQRFAPKIAPPPRNPNDSIARDVKASGLYISPGTTHRQECWDWLKFVSTRLVVGFSDFPARRSLALSEAFREQLSLDAQEVYDTYLPVLDRTPSKVTPDLFDNPQFDPYWLYRAIDRALQGGDLERELRQAQDVTEQSLACVRSGETPRTCAWNIDADYQGQAWP